ncbi:MAG: folylpolyglutamate synthase/dihydrofolate synthase family protein [Prochlorococcus sp.]|nr:dihydrofolate synthase [Prochlorococcaceae cyanobacterium Fu_MAG_50]
MDLGLERMADALAAMGNPCGTIPAIQVAGTNGKGSICSFIDSGLRAAGIHTGLTTSPHLVSWCERIRIDGALISAPELRQRLIKLKQLIEIHQLTPFEQLMAAAFDHFAAGQVELLILEVGLGGRLDATTAHPIRPVIAMARIGRDHCEHLGNSLREITAEKAAVISPGATVISAAQDPEVREVLNTMAARQGALIRWVKPLSEDWQLGLAGTMQRSNAAVARAALEALQPLGWELNQAQIRAGLAAAEWPARLQAMRWRGRSVLIDGAHNPQAAGQLARERLNWPDPEHGLHWILGIQAHKDAPAMLRELLKPADQAWIVPVTGHHSWSCCQLQAACPELAQQLREAEAVDQVLITLLNHKVWPSPAPIVAGSLYLLGDLLARRLFTAE